LKCDIGVRVPIVGRSNLLGRNEPDVLSEIRHGDDESLVPRVPGVTAPVDAAVRTGEVGRALEGGGREE
jgi:hypothetical protein